MSKIGKNMTETEYVLFKEKLRGVIAKMIIGALIGLFLGAAFATNTAEKVGFVLVLACVPYVWDMLPFIATNLYGFAIKAFLAVIGGVIITPISLIYNLVMVHAYQKANGMTGKRSAPQKRRPNTSNVYDAAFVEEKNGTDGVA